MGANTIWDIQASLIQSVLILGGWNREVPLYTEVCSGLE